MKQKLKLLDRHDAGRRLALLLAAYRDRPDCVVIGLPRGGVVVGYEIASALHLPLDICVVRKLGVPLQPELAMGAVAMGGVCVLHDDVRSVMGISRAEVDEVIRMELTELARRESVYRGDRPMPSLSGKTVLLADDGIATGATAEAAIGVLRQSGLKTLIVVVGVAPPDTVKRLLHLADEVVAVLIPRRLTSIGEWFEDFRPTTDREVTDLLRLAALP
jgi:putative phosphoribosyl transferase